jgi:hypothetical protein
MNSILVKKLHADIDAALKAVAVANGLSYLPGKMTYDQMGMAWGKVTFKTADYDKSVAPLLTGSEKVTVGSKIRLQNHVYTIVGFTTRGLAQITRDGDPTGKVFHVKGRVNLESVLVK